MEGTHIDKRCYHNKIYVTPYSRVLLKPIASQLVKRFTNFYEIQRCINVFIRAHHWFLSCARKYPVHSTLFSKSSQSYFTTGSLSPNSLPWRQAPWGSQLEFFFSTEPLRSQSLCNILSDEKTGFSLMNMLCLCQVYVSHIQHVIENSSFLHYIQVLHQLRLWNADHAYLTYLAPYPISLRSISTLSSHLFLGLQCRLFPSDCLTKYFLIK
jgi:hypothetical protein